LKKEVRNAAKNGFIKPTLSECFMTHRDFNWITKIPEHTTILGYTSDKCIDGIATCMPGSVTAASKAFNNITTEDESWKHTTSSATWIQYQFPTSRRIERLDIWSVYDSGWEALKDFTFVASNTGVFAGEDIILTSVVLTGEHIWSINETKEFTFLNDNYYTYYRINMTGKEESFGKTYEYMIRQIKMYEIMVLGNTYYSEDLCVNGVATASSSYSTDVASRAFDNNITTKWRSNTDNTAWIQYQFPISTVVEKLVLTPAVDYLIVMPTSFVLKASDSGNFTGEEDILLTQTDIDPYSNYLSKVFKFNNNSSYSYYRLSMINKEGAFDLGTLSEYAISEIQLMQKI